MFWLPFAVFAAFFESSKDILSKKFLTKKNRYILMLATPFLTAIYFSILLFFVGIPPLNSTYFLALILSSLLNAVVQYLYVKALQISEISNAIPFLNFTPGFLLFSSPIIVHEYVKYIDIIGIIVLLLGSYLLSLRTVSDYRLPFKKILRDPGPKLMLTIAFIWSITANLDKLGVENSSTIFWLFSLHGCIFLMTLPWIFFRQKSTFIELSKSWCFLIPISLANTLAVGCQMIALKLTFVTYVISIKRFSTIITACIGCLYFRESWTKYKLIGMTLMFVGGVLILK